MCLIGLIISYYRDTNTSAAIVGVAIATYRTKNFPRIGEESSQYKVLNREARATGSILVGGY